MPRFQQDIRLRYMYIIHVRCTYPHISALYNYHLFRFSSPHHSFSKKKTLVGSSLNIVPAPSWCDDLSLSHPIFFWGQRLNGSVEVWLCGLPVPAGETCAARDLQNMTRQPWLDEAVERLGIRHGSLQAFPKSLGDVQLMPGIPGDLSSL